MVATLGFAARFEHGETPLTSPAVENHGHLFAPPLSMGGRAGHRASAPLGNLQLRYQICRTDPRHARDQGRSPIGHEPFNAHTFFANTFVTPPMAGSVSAFGLPRQPSVTVVPVPVSAWADTQ